MVLQLISKSTVDFSGSCVVGGIGSVVSTRLAVLPLSWLGGLLKAGVRSLEVVGDVSGSGGMEREGLGSEIVVVAGGDAAVTSCDALRSLSPLEVSEVSGVVRSITMGSEGGGMDWQVVGVEVRILYTIFRLFTLVVIWLLFLCSFLVPLLELFPSCCSTSKCYSLSF